MRKTLKKSLSVILVLLTVLSFALSGCAKDADSLEDTTQDQTQNQTQDQTDNSAQTPETSVPEDEYPIELLVYAGAGLKNAMEDIKTAYESENNVIIEYVYAGSTQLISQIELSGKGDVFIVGSESAYKTAKEDGFASETCYQVAHHTPCIAVQAGNPKGITSLADLAQEGITVILGDPEANAIGQTAQKLIEKNGLAGINDNVVSQTATVNEIVTLIVGGEADAGIVTADSVYSNADIEIITIPDDQNLDQIIPVCTLTMSDNADAADKFVEFIASDAGKQIFEDNGFAAVQ